MRIEDTQVGAAGAKAVEQTTAKTVVKNGPGPQKAEDRDSVEISSLSASLSAATDREARIEQLKLEVQAGRYNPPASEVAKQIVDETLSERQ
jgi:anti-sigma28 factor (negative regulator of flagellin synthesis)